MNKYMLFIVEIWHALLQILHSDWLSHRALFVIVHDEHKQDGGRAFLQSFACNRRNIVHNKLFELFCLQISTKTNSILALVVSERIVNSVLFVK